MAIVEKVTLVDDYSSKAKNIAKSTSAMASAMESIKGKASSFSSAMKSAFDRKYTVNIKEIGSNKVNNSLRMIQGKLDKLNKPYSIEITTKMGRLEKLKSNLSAVKNTANSLKSPFNNISNSLNNFKMDLSNFRAAKKEARSLQKELKNITGRRHKVNIDMENPIKSAFKGGFDKMFGGLKSGFSKVGGFFSKLNPFSGFGGGGDAGGPGGGGGLGMLGSIVGGNLITGAITKGLSALGGVFESTISKGFNRLSTIQSSKAKLRGLDYSESDIKTITSAVTNAVTGTQYGMGEGMQTASSAIAAGVNPKNIEKYLKNIANISAATGSDFTEIGSLMNKIQTTGKLQGDELMQLSDRGLPILQEVAKLLGTDANTAREKISKGEVSADMAMQAAANASGSVADEMAKTWDGAKMNFGAALSKLGAGLLGGSGGEEGGIFEAMTPALLKVNDVLNGLVPSFKSVGDAVGNFASGGLETLKGAFAKASTFLSPIIEKLSTSFTDLVERTKAAFEPLVGKIKPIFDGLMKAVEPIITTFRDLLGDKIGDEFSMLGTVVELLASGLNLLADGIIAFMPTLQSIGAWIAENILPALGQFRSFFVDSIFPVLVQVASILIDTFGSALTNISSFITDVAWPAFQVIADVISAVVTPVFEAVGAVVQAAVGMFESLVGAIASAIDAFFSIPGKIASAIGGIGGMVKGAIGGLFGGKHATGTEYFAGGMTQINERGQEMMRLPQGTKIYPAGKTDRIIRKEVKNTSNVDRSISSPNITINVSGANMTNQDVGRVISKELRRLGVVV